MGEEGISAQKMREYEEIVTLVSKHVSDTADKMAEMYERQHPTVPGYIALRRFAKSVRAITAEHFVQAVVH